jgi:hypothetical protein
MTSPALWVPRAVDVVMKLSTTVNPIPPVLFTPLPGSVMLLPAPSAPVVPGIGMAKRRLVVLPTVGAVVLYTRTQVGTVAMLPKFHP